MVYATPSNISGIQGILLYANNVTGQWFMVLFVYSLLIIIFITLKQRMYRVSDSLSVACVVSLILSAMFWAAGVIPSKHIMFLLILTVLSFIYTMIED